MGKKLSLPKLNGKDNKHILSHTISEGQESGRSLAGQFGLRLLTRLSEAQLGLQSYEDLTVAGSGAFKMAPSWGSCLEASVSHGS